MAGISKVSKKHPPAAKSMSPPRGSMKAGKITVPKGIKAKAEMGPMGALGKSGKLGGKGIAKVAAKAAIPGATHRKKKAM